MDRNEQRDLVRRGYDAISRAYRDDEGRSDAAAGENIRRLAEWVDEMAGLLGSSGRILDLGCGSGVPATKLLVEKGFEVVGLDFSPVQIARARQLVPGAKFIEADIATWKCEPSSFDGIVSLYALIHLPLQDQRELFPRIRRWLRPHGYFLAIVGHEQWTGVEEYFGVPMFWEHADRATYLDWMTKFGLRPIWDRFVPEGISGHTLVLAQAEQDAAI
jgi:SAM-dependent methyltransferase